MSQKEFTGRKMLILVVSSFALIIGVNLFMAFKAVATFPGLETKNSYVASQSFDADRAAQVGLGWNVSSYASGGLIVLSITDAQGNPVQAASLQSTLGRATHVNEDQSPEFEFDGTAYVAPVELAPGNWNLRMQAISLNGTNFRQRVIVDVRD